MRRRAGYALARGVLLWLLLCVYLGLERRKLVVLVVGEALVRLRVRLVGVLALLYGAEDARGVPLGELDLLLRLRVRGRPDRGELEEGRGGVEGVGGLSVAFEENDMSATRELQGLYAWGVGGMGVSPRHLVGSQDLLAAVEGLLRELLDVGPPRRVVNNCVVVSMLYFHLRSVSTRSSPPIANRVCPARSSVSAPSRACPSGRSCRRGILRRRCAAASRGSG